AFTQLLRELPSDVNMALVLVQHLDPTYKSMLTELLSRTTNLTVLEVTDGVRVKPRHVYVIPPNTAMTISERVLHLTARIEVEGKHMPIDHFLQSSPRTRRAERSASYSLEPPWMVFKGSGLSKMREGSRLLKTRSRQNTMTFPGARSRRAAST